MLPIRSNLLDLIYKLVREHGKLLIRSEIVVKKFKFFSPSNTTDPSGYKTLLHTCSQIYNNVEVVSQDIPNNNFNKDLASPADLAKIKSEEDYYDQNLQSHLVEPNSRNIVSLNYNSHLSFLEYFHQTNKDASYVHKQQ